MRTLSKALLGLLALLVVTFGLSVSASAQDDARESVRGVLQYEGEPVEGVTITVVAPDSSVVGSAESDADGVWEVHVPGPGEYLVTLETDTLPEGLFPTRGNQREPNVPVGRTSNILFPIGTLAEVVEPIEEPADEPPADDPAVDPEVLPEDPEEAVDVLPGRGRGPLARWVGAVYSGIHFGLIIAIAGVGLSLVFGTTGLVNFAHGELVSGGALVVVVIHLTLGLPLVLAVPIAIAIAAGFGWVQERYFWGWLRNRGTGLIALMIITIGVALMLRNVYQYFFGAGRIRYRDFAVQRPMEIGPLLVVPRSLVLDAIMIVVLLAVTMALLFTRLGKATRAVADNPSLAAASGVNVDMVIRIVWTFGTALAALAGIFLAMSEGASFLAGFQILLLIFAAVIVGGLGTAFGAVVGGLIVGLTIQISTLWIPAEFKFVAALALMILVLLVRPQGVLGRRVRVG